MRASFLARALSVAPTLLVTPSAFGTVTAEFLLLLPAVTAGLLFEAMSHVDCLSPEPHHLWLYMENQEVKCIVGQYGRGKISATWTNLNISRVVWNAKREQAATERAAERERGRVPGQGRDQEKELDDLGQALDRLDRPPRPPRPDPPGFQSPPRSVRRYPTPEGMRKIRDRRLHLQQDIQPSSSTSMRDEHTRHVRLLENNLATPPSTLAVSVEHVADPSASEIVQARGAETFFASGYAVVGGRVLDIPAAAYRFRSTEEQAATSTRLQVTADFAAAAARRQELQGQYDEQVRIIWADFDNVDASELQRQLAEEAEEAARRHHREDFDFSHL